MFSKISRRGRAKANAGWLATRFVKNLAAGSVINRQVQPVGTKDAIKVRVKI